MSVCIVNLIYVFFRRDPLGPLLLGESVHNQFLKKKKGKGDFKLDRENTGF